MAIASSSSKSEAEASLARWARAEAERSDFDDLIYQSGALAWMAGQLFVRDVEVPVQRLELAVQVGVEGDFLSMPFEEAIRYFLERAVLPPEEAFDALRRLRERSFTASLLATDRIREAAFRALVTALEGGGDFDSFAAAIRNEEYSFGVSPSSHGYLRTVFDTNVVSAYSSGRDRQLTDEAVVDALPYRRYVAVLDRRTRPEHAALNGKVWDARVSDEWRRFQSPNGYNCRCMVVSETERDERGLSMRAEHPDTAFNTIPGLGP